MGCSVRPGETGRVKDDAYDFVLSEGVGCQLLLPGCGSLRRCTGKAFRLVWMTNRWGLPSPPHKGVCAVLLCPVQSTHQSSSGRGAQSSSAIRTCLRPQQTALPTFHLFPRPMTGRCVDTRPVFSPQLETIREHHPTSRAPSRTAEASATAALGAGFSICPLGLLTCVCPP